MAPRATTTSGARSARVARILVIGASRGIGSVVTKQALERGYVVRALSHCRGRSEAPDLEYVAADALDPGAIAAAMNGVDVVVQALGISAGPQMVRRLVTLFSEATRVLLPAMRDAGVRRLVSVTGFGAGDSRANVGCLPGLTFELFLGRAYADKDVQEKLIRDSECDWTIVRPVIHTNGPRLGRYKVLDNPDRWRNGLISRRDVADFIVRQIEDDTFIGRTPVVTY